MQTRPSDAAGIAELTPDERRQFERIVFVAAVGAACLVAAAVIGVVW